MMGIFEILATASKLTMLELMFTLFIGGRLLYQAIDLRLKNYLITANLFFLIGIFLLLYTFIGILI
jgi:hypothetical protein